MERAEPAIVRTAASRSAAVMSGILVFAISSSCARVILPTLSVCGLAEPLSSGSRRRLDDEGEGFVCKCRDDHGQGQAWLNTLGLGIEGLAEFHDVEATLTERGANGGRRIGLARWHLQLDEADNFLCHAVAPYGCKR
jgi:hypothetical protein